MEERLDLRHLRHFVAVAEELHFTRGAARAGIEQSPLSRSIRNLEKRLGVALFERTRRATQLTPAGESLLDYARSILASADEARIDIRALAGEKNQYLRLGVCEGAPLPRLARLLTSLRQAEPHIHVRIFELSMAQKIHDLQSGFLDAAMTPESGYGKGIKAEAVWQDSAMALLPRGHRLAEKDSLDLAEVVREPLILCRPDTGLGQQSQIEEFIRRAHVTPNIVDRVATLCILVMLVFAGYGVGIATEAAAGVAEGEREAGDDDDDHGDDLGDRAFDRLQNLLERRFPRHGGAGGVGRGNQASGDQENRRCVKAVSEISATLQKRSNGEPPIRKCG